MQTEPIRRVRRRGWVPLLALVVVLLALLGAVALFSGRILVGVALAPYRDQVYPNVYALGVDLGGLTVEQAAARLALAAESLPEGELLLGDGERHWSLPWPELGIRLDAAATAQAAFAVGRGNPDAAALFHLLTGRCDVAPVYALDPSAARAALEAIALEVYQEPVDAELRIEDGQLIALPGQPGRALNVEATLENLVATVAHLGPDTPVHLTLMPVLPDVADASPVQSQAEAMLDCQIDLSAYDVLTGEVFAWRLERAVMGGWLRVEQAEDGGLAVRVELDAVRATLAGLASDMGAGRGLRLDEATEQVAALFAAGGGAAELYVTHPSWTYAVQPGDMLATIAGQVGVPPGLIAEANPGVDLNWLSVGQEITIPSQDVLTPYIPVRDRRIVVSIDEQRMRVYEGDHLRYDWPVSTGIARSPTYTGVFQVLDKEEMAYASQWNLWMPHFLAVYRAGGGVYNGIHALPILSNGQRLWEGSLGSPASFGCIILGIEEAELLYNWADVGVLTIIE
ncbi:MAG: peptidoglycan binding domain-containing protein [Anaerolineae bacterium]|nr:peptidoglycan binding domain-containing protein [Anaerolineae bacterium]